MIECEVETTDIIEQLRSSIIDSYDTGVGGDTVTNIVTALLNFQNVTPLITIGTIEPTDTIEFSVTDITILNALYELREIVGGYISVNISRELNWEDDIGEDKGQQIRFKKNLKGITKEVDWGGLYTRFYPTGNGCQLSDIFEYADEADKDSDVSYGYLTLTEDNVCYKGWTGEGDSLPADFKVWRVTTWSSETPSSIQIEAGWNDPNYARDGDTGTAATWNSGSWGTGYIRAIFSGGKWLNGVRVWVGVASNPVNIYIQTSSDGVNYNYVYYGAWDSGWEGGWKQFDFSLRWLTHIQLHWYQTAPTPVYVALGEVEGRYSVANETSLWKQGENERIVRCDIGDYHAGDTYYLSYYLADYLKAWDAIKPIGSYEDISAKENNGKIDYATALIDWGRYMLNIHKVPPVSYEVSAIMLSECGANFAFEELQLGSIVNVIDEELGIDTDARVVKIDYPDLNDPSQATVEISSKVSDIADTFKTIFTKII